MPLVNSLREPELDFFLGILDRVRSVADVSVEQDIVRVYERMLSVPPHGRHALEHVSSGRHYVINKLK